MKLSQIIEATRGTLTRGSADGIVISGIQTDSRLDCSGSLFVPLAGETFDGHDFITPIAAKGALGCVASRDFDTSALPAEFFVIRVADTLAALQDISGAYRQQFDSAVIAVTGSCGKTTTKNMLRTMFSVAGDTVATAKNENNEIGVPYTLLRIASSTKYTVVEMGMRALGEISRLAQIAAPTHAVITNVEKTHIGRLGSEENIARAKGELIESLDSSGTAFLNADNIWTSELRRRTAATVITFGIEQGDVRSENVKFSLDGISFDLLHPSGRMSVTLPLPGKAAVYNALSAAAAGLSLGLSPETITTGLAAPIGESGRLVKHVCDNGTVILDDTYNSNPASLSLALELLGGVAWHGRKVAVLGDMLELGDFSESEHFRVGAEFAAANTDLLVTMGTEAAHIAAGARGAAPAMPVISFDTYELLADAASSIFKSGDLILVKGSRGMKMERIVNLISGNLTGGRL